MDEEEIKQIKERLQILELEANRLKEKQMIDLLKIGLRDLERGQSADIVIQAQMSIVNVLVTEYNAKYVSEEDKKPDQEVKKDV